MYRPLQALSQLDDLEFLSIDQLQGETHLTDPVGALDAMGTSYDLRDVAALTNLRKLSARGLNLGAAGKPDWQFGRNTASSTENFKLDSWLELPDSGTDSSIAKATLIQDDKKIVVVGHRLAAGGSPQFTITRLNPDGSRDTSFNSSGQVLFAGSGAFSFAGIGGVIATSESSAATVALDLDGNLLVAGYVRNLTPTTERNRIAVIRLKPNGTLDSNFGNGGRVVLDVRAGADEVNSIAVDMLGRILIAGASATSTDDATLDTLIIRLQSNGALDTSFGQVASGTTRTGYLIYPTSVEQDHVTDIAALSSGKILAHGMSTSPIGSTSYRNKIIFQLIEDGTIDSTFGTGGLVREILSPNSSTYSAAQLLTLPDGRFISAGHFDRTGLGYQIIISQYLANGTPDPSFGNSGRFVLSVGTIPQSTLHSLTMTTDGKILGVGETTHPTQGTQPLVFRLTADGFLDKSFGDNGILITPTGNSRARFRSVASDQNGRMILVGESYSGSTDRMLVSVLLPDDSYSLSSLTSLSNLQVLSLSDNDLRDVRPLAHLSQLKWLDLNNNRVESIDGLFGQTIVTTAHDGMWRRGPVLAVAIIPRRLKASIACWPEKPQTLMLNSISRIWILASTMC